MNDDNERFESEETQPELRVLGPRELESAKGGAAPGPWREQEQEAPH